MDEFDDYFDEMEISRELFEGDLGRRSRVARPKTSLNLSEIELITKYLENPTSQGIWYYRAKWKADSGISRDIW